MSIANQINKNLLDPENHGTMLNAIIRVLEEEGEKGVKALIERFIR